MVASRPRSLPALLSIAATSAVCAAPMLVTAPVAATVNLGSCSATALAPVVFLSSGRYVGYGRLRVTCTAATSHIQFQVQMREQDPGSNPDDIFVNNGFGGSWTFTAGQTRTLTSPTVRCNTEVGA